MMASSFDLMIFDCDGVLVDSEIWAIRAYDTVFERAGTPLQPGQLAHLFGLKQNVIMDILGKAVGARLPDSLEAQIWPELKILFQKHLQPTKGLVPFLEGLKQMELRCCVASSSSMERIGFSLELTGLRHFFGDHLFSSSMVEHGKPAPDLFLFAAREMGVEPARCVVIEDSPHGVEGAVRAGMTAIGYTGGSHEIPDHVAKLEHAGVTHICASWAEVACQIGVVT